VSGGLGEIGRNMLVLEYGEDIIIIDAGLMFPENDMFGIDIVIPNLSYVLERADRVRAVIVTHGHEDHIGCLPYLMASVKAPIYGTRLTMALAKVRLCDARIRDAELNTIEPGDELTVGPFRIEFFHVSHSIPDGVGLGIQTPIGLIVHSGDFKFDHSPADGQRTDFSKLAELGGRGVLLLMSDSTNAEKTGYTPSEQLIGETLSHVFAAAEGRVIVATFASNISRIQQVIDTAYGFGRKVAVVGRSMTNNVRIARDLGYLTVPDDTLVSIDQLDHYAYEQVALVCTGSQGEPTSALVRMGQNQFRSISIVRGDTIIVSATPIPGNEELVNRTLDNLFRLGAFVHYDEILDVHVSGHASQEEQKLMINLLQPQHFMPIHGEYRHLVLHGALAEQCGIPRENIHVIETGDVLEIGECGVEVVDHLDDTDVYVDGRSVGDVEKTVIRERRILANSGILIVLVNLDKYTNSVLGQPQIVTRGFVPENMASDVMDWVREETVHVVENGGSRSELAERLQNALQRCAYSQTGRRPTVVSVVNKI